VDLAHPEYGLFGEDRARVLRRLVHLTEPTSGRRIHQLSGVTSLRTTQRLLDEFVGIGLVTVRPIGAANAYEVNREHVMWGPIEQALALPVAAERRIAEALREIMEKHTVCTALYGGFARGDASHSADVDVLIVWNGNVAQEERVEILRESAERIRRITGNEAQLFAITKAVLDRLIARQTTLIKTLQRDARRLTGADIKRLIKG
jgi:predicted nucleotidyltransferase